MRSCAFPNLFKSAPIGASRMRSEDVIEVAGYAALGAGIASVIGKAWRGERVTALDIAALAASAVPIILSALERDGEKRRHVGSR